MLLSLLLSLSLPYSWKNLRAAREIRSVMSPSKSQEICQERAIEACLQAVDEGKCAETFRKQCEEEVTVQEYSESIEVVEMKGGEESRKVGNWGVEWEIAINICLVFLLLLTISLSIFLCWRSLHLNSNRKSVPEIEFKVR